MRIESLSVNNCRLLDNISLKLSPSLNFIIGPNASGKTSLLEAISILSTGRSFRTSHISDVISTDSSSVLISANVITSSGDVKIGIEKSKAHTRIRINKKDIYSQSELSRYIPVTTIHPLSFNLITGSPSLRRSYIDWIAFYLYPEYHALWKTYYHILKQRNLCLKFNKHRYSLEKWTEKLVIHQPDIIHYREKSFNALLPELNKITELFLGDSKITIDLKSGFPINTEINTESLNKYYKEKESYDLKVQRTTSGIHAADFLIQINNRSVSKSASRGQLKLISSALLLAQSHTIKTILGTKSIILFDDFSSELDAVNGKKILDYLDSTNQQVFLTSVDELSFTEQHKMFHVKHGTYTIYD